jgi:hypothetical protein
MIRPALYSAIAVAALGVAGVLASCSTAKPDTTMKVATVTARTATPPAVQSLPLPADGQPRTVAMRRVTESQYRQTIADLYGPDIEVVGRFEPDSRRDGLMAVGSAELSISGGGFEQYLSMARSISDQVLDDKHRAKFAPCKPADDKAADDACTAEFLKANGRNLFRRPLTDSEVNSRVALAREASGQLKTYNGGLKLAFVSLLTAPEFLFRTEMAEADPGAKNQYRLDGYTKAQRLSYLFWNTTPDPELLDAAASGEIHTEAGLKKQVERLGNSPKVERGARAFFTDMLQFSRFENTIKDGKTFPKYSFAIAEAAQEQTLRTLVDHLITRNGDYREIFTTPNTFINRPLAALYDVPFLSANDWMPYKYPDDADQAGVITQAAFLSMFSHPGRTSPTKRGVAVHEVFLCHVMPLPADNVDFTLINDTSNGVLKTVRSRLNAHATNPTCAACHHLTDPLGLALERFDSIGQHRTTENGEKIDASSELNGVKFESAKGLGQVLAKNPEAPNCLVRNMFAYGAGRLPSDPGETRFVQGEYKAFADAGYRLRPMMKDIASSQDFYRVVIPKPPAPAKPETAALETAIPGEAK